MDLEVLRDWLDFERACRSIHKIKNRTIPNFLMIKDYDGIDGEGFEEIIVRYKEAGLAEPVRMTNKERDFLAIYEITSPPVVLIARKRPDDHWKLDKMIGREEDIRELEQELGIE